jgi:serine protease Do
MKTFVVGLLPLLFTLVSYQSFAQEDINKDNEIEEIIIKKKGGKDATLKIEIKDGNIKVNGKSLVEFNQGEEITITKKKLSIGRNFGNGFPDEMMQQFNFEFQDLFQGMTRGKRAGRAFLGVSTDESKDGVIITDISKGSAAEKSGLEKDDIIVSIDGVKIDNPTRLSEFIEKKKVNDEVSIDILRKKKKKTIKAVLLENKDMSAYNFSAPRNSEKNIIIAPRGREDNSEWRMAKKPAQKLGLRVTDIKEGKGVQITEVETESAAAAAGLMVDDILTELNGTAIANTDDARKVFQENKSETSYQVKVKRNNQEKIITVTFPKEIKTVDL